MKYLLFLLMAVSWTKNLMAECTLKMDMQGTIGAGTLDFLERAEVEAAEKKCDSILVLINTPGGSLQSTRLIVENMLNSKIPFLCLVYPAGAHAGSAGAIILQACHVAGAVPTTNLGAATPIQGSGEALPEDLRKKLINDTTSWLDGLTKRHGRNEKFGRDIIVDAKSVTAEEALKLKAIDVVPATIDEFLNFAKGREVSFPEDAKRRVVIGPLVEFKTDVRAWLLSALADPELAYLLLMASLALLYFELTHPGFIAPGVVGGIGLVLAMIALHKMDVQWGGVALIALGLLFLFLEIFVPSFGALGIGGLAALVVGSVFLFEAGSGYSISGALIGSTVFVFGGMMLGLTFMAASAFKLKKTMGARDLNGRRGRILKRSKNSLRAGQIEVSGEIWSFRSDSDVQIGDEVEIVEVQNLTLIVKPIGGPK